MGRAWIAAAFLGLFLVSSCHAAASCSTCEELVRGIDAGFAATKKSKGHGGGNTEWEERRLKAWSHSELRFVEVLEHACNRKSIGCQGFLEDVEDDIEEWFHDPERKDDGLRDFLCVTKSELCCPANLSGPACDTACPVDEKGRKCSGQGKCEGEGSRLAPTSCSCNMTWTGTLCNECIPNYILNDDGQCERCYEGCLGQCLAPGSTGCASCKEGFYLDESDGHCQGCDIACKHCTDQSHFACTECARYADAAGKGKSVWMRVQRG